MKGLSLRDKRGMSLIELLVAMVISAMVIAGIYKVFISQSKAYTVQDQVVEVQQNIRVAMGMILRDLRMAGFDDDNDTSTIEIDPAINPPILPNAISVNYEYYNTTTGLYEKHTVAYRIEDGSLKRQLSINDVPPPEGFEVLLEHVDSLNLTYGVDANDDGAIDDQNGDGTIDNSDWIAAASVGSQKVIGVRVVLTARPDQTNADVVLQPRTLDSVVTLRNLCLR